MILSLFVCSVCLCFGSVSLCGGFVFRCSHFLPLPIWSHFVSLCNHVTLWTDVAEEVEGESSSDHRDGSSISTLGCLGVRH